MSVDNLKEYTRRVATDLELKAKAKAFGITNMDEHMREAEGMGLDWTMDDLVTFRREVVDAEGDIEELTEEDLERVAAGIITITAAVVGGVVAGAVVAGGIAAGASAGGVTAAGDGGW